VVHQMGGVLPMSRVPIVLVLALLSCGQPGEPARVTLEHLDANMPISTTGVWDPNDTITVDDLMIDFVGQVDPNTPLMMVHNEDEEVCGITRDWTYYRGPAHQDKSCEDYRTVLRETADNMGWAEHFFGLAICWLMDPCSKGEP